MRQSNNEKILTVQGNTIDKQFYYNLLSLEKIIIKEPQLDAVQQALAMYRKCVEYFDNIQDPIKYYFLDKIQQALSETKTLMLFINSKSEIESSKTISPVKRSSISDLPPPLLSDQQIMDKKLRSKQVTLQIKLHEAADQQSEILNTMVTDFTTNTTSTDQKVRQDLNQQADIIHLRNFLNSKSLSKFNNRITLKFNLINHTGQNTQEIVKHKNERLLINANIVMIIIYKQQIVFLINDIFFGISQHKVQMLHQLLKFNEYQYLQKFHKDMLSQQMKELLLQSTQKEEKYRQYLIIRNTSN